MMQKFTNLIFFMALLISGSLIGQDVIWPDANDADQVATSTFDGGMNGWVAEGLESADNNQSAAEVLWIWSPDAMQQGFFGGGSNDFASPTVGNGCLHFDSDFLDNAGNLSTDMNNEIIWDNMGSGTAPATDPLGCDVNLNQECRVGHAGQITSPSIDLSNSGPAVVLKFNQYYRHLVDGEGNTQFTFVEVSNDGGNAWTRFAVNELVQTNIATDPAGVVLLNVSSVAAGQSDVQVRFIFDGYYYFWLIDDVQFIELPSFHVGITNFFYGTNRFTPQSQIVDDTVGFWVSPTNLGSDLENVTFRVEVQKFDENGDLEEILHEEDLLVPLLNAGVIGGDADENGAVDTAFFFENSWAPGLLDVGDYAIVYSIEHAEIDMDIDPTDNVAGNFFSVSEDFYSKENGPNISFKPGGGDATYAIGNMYRTSEDFGNVNWQASDAFFGAVVNAADGPINQYACNVYLLKLNPGEAPNFPTFDPMDGFLDNPAFEAIAGFALHEFSDAGDSEEAFVPLQDFNNSKPVLEPNSFYFLMFEYEGGVPFHDCNQNTFQYWQISSLTYSSQWFLGGFGQEVAVGGRLILEMAVSADSEILAETNVTTSPNPTTDFVNVAVNFAEATDAQIIMTNMDGSVLHFEEHDGVQNEVFNIDVSSFVPGTYTVHVNTPLGISTDKVVVID